MGNVFVYLVYLLNFHKDGFEDAKLTQFNFNFENDFIFQTDEYYNHSSKLEWIFLNKQTNYLYNINLKQEMYTPSDHKKGYLNNDDMPYTATLKTEFGIHKISTNNLYSFDIALGITGRYALGEESMEAIHSILPTRPIYFGWKSQNSSASIGRIAFTHKYKLVLRKDSADAIFNYGINLGNLRSNIFAGAQLRYGIQLPNDYGLYSVYSNNVNYKEISKKTHIYFVVGATQSYVHNDMTLRGLDMIHNQTGIYTGFSYKHSGFNISLLLNKETKRFTKQKDDNYGYANILLGWSY